MAAPFPGTQACPCAALRATLLKTGWPTRRLRSRTNATARCNARQRRWNGSLDGRHVRRRPAAFLDAAHATSPCRSARSWAIDGRAVHGHDDRIVPSRPRARRLSQTLRGGQRYAQSAFRSKGRTTVSAIGSLAERCAACRSRVLRMCSRNWNFRLICAARCLRRWR